MGNLTLELQLVNSAVDCIIDPNNYDESHRYYNGPPVIVLQ